MKVRFLNLSIKDRAQKRDLLRAVDKVFTHGRIVLGPEVETLEKKVAEFCGVKYAVGVNSGTDALYFALRALGIGRGDEVITTCLSFVATANAIAMTGAKPVFVDIREDFNINPERIEKAVNSRTKAIVVVHFTGRLCEMPALKSICRKYRLFLVEDAAQAFGASFKGQKAGSFGKVGALSMNPMKILAALGEAGMVVTNDEKIHETIKTLRYNGAPDKINAQYISLNGRLDTIQAAILLVRFKYFSRFVAHRRRAARYYSKRLVGLVSVPKEQKNYLDVYYTYNIRCERRDKLREFLTKRGIETKIHHEVLIPKQKAYRDWNHGSWPAGERIVKSSLCLPLHEHITKKELDYVVDGVKSFYRS